MQETVHNPSGVTEVTRKNAPRLDTLEGKTICQVWTSGIFRGEEVHPVLTELLQKRFPTAKVIPYTEFPTSYPRDWDGVAELLKNRGCDAVITGPGA